MWVDLIMDLVSEDNKVDRPVDPRGGSTSCPELICRRQPGRQQYIVVCTGAETEEEVGITSEEKSGARHLRHCE